MIWEPDTFPRRWCPGTAVPRGGGLAAASQQGAVAAHGHWGSGEGRWEDHHGNGVPWWVSEGDGWCLVVVVMMIMMRRRKMMMLIYADANSNADAADYDDGGGVGSVWLGQMRFKIIYDLNIDGSLDWFVLIHSHVSFSTFGGSDSQILGTWKMISLWERFLPPQESPGDQDGSQLGRRIVLADAKVAHHKMFQSWGDGPEKIIVPFFYGVDDFKTINS